MKEVNMTDIRELLKEAKPLYIKRKKRRKQIKDVCVGMSFAFLLGILSLNQYQPKVNLSTGDLYAYLYENPFHESDFSLLADADDIFPTDEYGLIKVS